MKRCGTSIFPDQVTFSSLKTLNDDLLNEKAGLSRIRPSSDRGAQYTSGDFQKWRAGNNVTQSMGLTRVCWDNAVAENFFSHLKTEMYHHYDFPNHLSARTAIMEYIESWYYRRQPHSNNQGLPPATALPNYQNQFKRIAA